MNAYRTPVSNRKRRRVSTPGSSRFVRGVDTLAEMAATAAGYGNTYKVGKKLVNRVRKSIRGKINAKNESNTKVSHVKKGGQSGMLAGKIRRKGKKINRSYNTMQQQGIITREEFRFQDNIATQNESRLIGHTSLPVRATWYNIHRALLKTLVSKIGMHIASFTELTDVKGFIRVYYYTEWSTGSLQTTFYTIPANGGNPVPWKDIADGFADWMLTLGAIGLDPVKTRWMSVEYVPPSSYSPLNQPRAKLSFSQLYCTVNSKSMLKFQNQSGVYKGLTEEEAIATTDDVDNVPVELSTYYVTGNQFIHQNARTSATVGLGFLGFDQTFTNSTVGSEPCPASEILNCTNKTKITMDPGHVKTSIISYRKKLLFSQFIRMLVKREGATSNWSFTDSSYVKNLGHCRALHVDRVIGSFLGKVRLMGEVELKQQVLVQGSLNTATDQYEVQRE